MDPRWHALRAERRTRDRCTCFACGSIDQTIHVHHMRYYGALWNISIDELQSLCSTCHAMLPPHPRAGVWYARGSGGRLGISFRHCPACAAGVWIDTDGIGIVCDRRHHYLPPTTLMCVYETTQNVRGLPTWLYGCQP